MSFKTIKDAVILLDRSRIIRVDTRTHPRHELKITYQMGNLHILMGPRPRAVLMSAPLSDNRAATVVITYANEAEWRHDYMQLVGVGPGNESRE